MAYDNSESLNENFVTDGAVSEITMGVSLFQPLQFIGTWEEPGTKTKHLPVVIIVPSGIGKNDFSLSVEYCDSKLIYVEHKVKNFSVKFILNDL